MSALFHKFQVVSLVVSISLGTLTPVSGQENTLNTETTNTISIWNEQNWKDLWHTFVSYKRFANEDYQTSSEAICVGKAYTWNPQFLQVEVDHFNASQISNWRNDIVKEFSVLQTQLLDCHNFSKPVAQNLSETDLRIPLNPGSELFERMGASAILYGHQRWVLDRLTERYLQLLSNFYQYLGTLKNPKQPDEEATKMFIAISQGFEFIWRTNQLYSAEYERFYKWSELHRKIKNIPNSLHELRFTHKDLDRVNWLFYVLHPYLNRPQSEMPNDLLKDKSSTSEQSALVPSEFYQSVYVKNNLLHFESPTSGLKRGLIVFSNLTWGLTNTVLGLALTAVLTPVSILSDITSPAAISSSNQQNRCLKVPTIAKNNLQLTMGVCPLGAEGVSLGLIHLGRMDWHEGGHSVQSAILGPFYLPAVLASYIIEGRENGFFERWATKWGYQNGHVKALKD